MIIRRSSRIHSREYNEKGRANIVRLAAIDEMVNALSVTAKCQIVNSCEERKQLEGDYIHIRGGELRPDDDVEVSVNRKISAESLLPSLPQ